VAIVSILPENRNELTAELPLFLTKEGGEGWGEEVLV
jgi:hypothetical protein